MKVEITRWKINTKQEPHRRGTIKKQFVRVDKEDTWSMDFVVACIVGPLVKQLRETKHSYGAIDKEDVPQELHDTYGTEGEHTEKYSVQAYEWVLNEIEWAMNEIANDNANEPPFHTKVGEMNFLPIDPKTKAGEVEFIGWESTPESEAANKAYHERIQRGCVLFGKYLTTMWS